METQVHKFPRPLLWTAGVAVILFSAVGIAAIMGWIPASMGGPDEAAAPVAQQPPRLAATQPAETLGRCSNCGVVESSRAVTTSGEGSGLGAAGGAVVGGLLGNQVGGGSGKKIATVVGAVGGAVAGNEVEKRVKTTTSYEVTVRMDDGSSRVVYEDYAPIWRTGEQVKIVDGAIRSN
jgi:outer membrane lipoprotein SlyB